MKLKIVKGYRRKMMLFSLGIGIVILCMVGISYAVWTQTFTQEEKNTLTTSCFHVSFLDDSPVSLLNTYPILDSEGKSLTPYTFTLKNNCDTYASYQINLEVLKDTTLMNSEYIKLSFNEKKPRILTYYEEISKTLTDAITSYKIDTSYLEPNEMKVLTLRLWMDEDTPLVEEAMNKIFQSKVTITTSFLNEAPVVTG